MPKLLAIIGTRPQYVKHAALETYIKTSGKHELVTVDTGQHYDNNMSGSFINELNIQTIKYNLDINQGSHTYQTSNMMLKLEPIIKDEAPDFVIVYGDTNSTLAGSIVASKLKIPIVHIEAGMRNHNLEVPEEINRVITDRIASLRLASSPTALNNLCNEGLSKQSYLVGDISSDLVLGNNLVNPNLPFQYNFVTIHRPYNTNGIERIVQILESINKLEDKSIFAIHPRTRLLLVENKIDLDKYSNIVFKEPISFYDSLGFIKYSKCVITDSGGVQKEAYLLKRKCISILPSTPWEETLEGNWNTLVFSDLEQLSKAVLVKPDKSKYKEGIFGDGSVSKKIVELLENVER